MRSEIKIVNTKDDANKVRLTREQIIQMATIKVRYDDAEYPESYDQSLKEGDEGYIEPIWRFEEEVDQAVLNRFGVNLQQ